METIRFEQAAIIVNQQDKIKIYTNKYEAISRMFSKSPFMQMTAWDTWEQIIDLGEPVATNDWSNFLFKKLDQLFEEVENYQNNPKYAKMQENILDMIKKCNELNIEIK